MKTGDFSSLALPDAQPGLGKPRPDARWMYIDSDLRLDGVKSGAERIDPLVYSAAYVHDS
ncbi:hypothetical protein [Luteimonas sp. 3794]|uniref:hypothetical protein n=1 Tax=Luteimonas sp. 3794 TaxID=2817730 RepID=UPI002862A387|nr:hypothetical protein [Luteimonas sp. 3794]MDR6991634.1 hypothetical protein [Luteimonas sp. 3794]